MSTFLMSPAGSTSNMQIKWQIVTGTTRPTPLSLYKCVVLNLVIIQVFE
jgi:hypothetical protein